METPPSNALKWTPVTPVGMAPAARASHTAVLDSVSKQMIIYGGANAPDFGDAWSLDTTSSQWTAISPSGTAPAGMASLERSV